MHRTQRFIVAGFLAAAGVLALASLASAQPSYPVGTDASTVSLAGAPGAIPYENGWAVPLAGARPAWFTPELEQRVLAAAGTPVAAPNDAPLPGVVGIRPGAWMISPAGCTMNFVFQKRGSFAIGDDFALVAIRSSLKSWVSPTTAVIGGPCGQYTGSGPETVAHYGHGLAIGTGGTPRLGLALTWKTSAYGWDGAAIFGDSGSPVRVTDFKAAGNLTHLVVDSKWLPSFIAGTRIGRILTIAKGWSLVNSPLCVLSAS